MMARRRVFRLMAVMASGAVVLGSTCTAIDFKKNIVSGTMSFIAGYTADLLGAVVPSANELLGGDAP